MSYLSATTLSPQLSRDLANSICRLNISNWVVSREADHDENLINECLQGGPSLGQWSMKNPPAPDTTNAR